MTAPTNPHTGATRLVLTLDKKAIGGYQVNLAAVDDKGTGLGRRLLGTKHYNQGTTTVLEDELTAADAHEIRAMLDAVYPVASVDEQPPVDQALRDRIADILATADGWTWVDGYDRTKSPTYQGYQQRADTVLAVLAPVDRAAVLTDSEAQPTALCAECGHPQTVHQDGDDPVTPGTCLACEADDAHHDYQFPTGGAA